MSNNRPFSEYIRHVMRNDRNELGMIINDKIRVKEYCDAKLDPVVVDELFRHRIYAGYTPEVALASITPPCVIRLNNGWHKMKFIFNHHDIAKKIDLATLKHWQAQKWTSAEWSYRQIVPGFTVERMLPPVHNLFKLFIFHGRVKYVWAQRYDVTSGRIGQLGCTMYTPDWQKLPVQWNKVKMINFDRPKRLDQMIRIAELLYDNAWQFMRVDLYHNQDEIRFSEMMQYHAGGTNGFGEWDYELGKHIDWSEVTV